MVVRGALLLSLIVGALGTHDLSSTYPFRLDLHDNYTLYWTFDNVAQNITFAVRVRTTGWVGFGVSPNGTDAAIRRGDRMDRWNWKSL